MNQILVTTTVILIIDRGGRQTDCGCRHMEEEGQASVMNPGVAVEEEADSMVGGGVAKPARLADNN